MLDPKGLLPLHYYDYGQPFSGSHAGMRYRIEKAEGEEGSHFLATAWMGPYTLRKTPPEKRKSASFPFTEEGKAAAAAWLLEVYEQDREAYDHPPGILDESPYEG